MTIRRKFYPKKGMKSQFFPTTEMKWCLNNLTFEHLVQAKSVKSIWIETEEGFLRYTKGDEHDTKNL